MSWGWIFHGYGCSAYVERRGTACLAGDGDGSDLGMAYRDLVEGYSILGKGVSDPGRFGSVVSNSVFWLKRGRC